MPETPSNPSPDPQPSTSTDAGAGAADAAFFASPGPIPTDAPPGTTIGPNGRLVDPAATPDQKTYCTLIHLTLLLYFVLAILAIIAPIVMWQVKKADSAFIDDHGKETVNFHISLMIYGVAIFLLSLLLAPALGLGVCTLIVGGAALFVLAAVGMLQASFAANRGEIYRYPACIRLLR